MDEDYILVALLVLGLLALGGIVLVGILPTWFAIHGDWGAFNTWFTFAMGLSRIVYFLCIPLYFILSIINLSLGYFTGSVQATILAIWGVPVYKKAILNMVFTPLTGLEFQRTILLIIFIYGLTVSLVFSSRSEKSKEDS